MGIPKTVLSTRMTGSARETEGRIRALYQRHRRPAIALVVLAALAAALCGGLVSCQTAPARVELAIDHHGTHVPFTQTRWVEPEAAATVEMIYALLEELEVEMDQPTADCLYTGLTTDTGCFRYRSVTPRTHRIAGALLELGARNGDINQWMFESKTKGQVEAERLVMDAMEFSWEGRCALIQVPLSVYPRTGVKESDLDGLASRPREIQGVVLGLTLKEKEGGKVKVSVRANPPADASRLCSRFGGGGHQGAAGCTLEMPLDQARQAMEQACGEYLQELGLL